MIDIDDTPALNTLKTLKATDQAGDLILQSGDRMEDEARVAASASAPFLTAAATASNIQSQAMMQKMLGAMLRQEAARSRMKIRCASVTPSLPRKYAKVFGIRCGLQLQRARVVSWMWRKTHGGHGGAFGGSRYPCDARPPVGAFVTFCVALQDGL